MTSRFNHLQSNNNIEDYTSDTELSSPAKGQIVILDKRNRNLLNNYTKNATSIGRRNLVARKTSDSRDNQNHCLIKRNQVTNHFHTIQDNIKRKIYDNESVASIEKQRPQKIVEKNV